MKPARDIAREAARLEVLYRAKAHAEIEAAGRLLDVPDPVRGAGDEFADVLLLKGEPGPEDLEAGHALGGADGEAARKALDAIGLPEARFAWCTRTPGVPEDLRYERLRLVVEAVDPNVIVALDHDAATDLASAYEHPQLTPGTLERVRGRMALAVDGLEASLDDQARKRRVWRQLKALSALTGPRT